MKKKTMMILTVLVSALMAAGNYAQSDDGTQDNLRTFMRLKLKRAQEVLEGLSVENYDQIAESAQEISLLSQTSQWQVLQTPEYVRRSEIQPLVSVCTVSDRSRRHFWLSGCKQGQNRSSYVVGGG